MPPSAFLTNITGHKRLYKLGIYHCDISDGNLMFIRKDHHTFGILIDFDLAVIADLPSKNKRRTGTRPFMAIDLLIKAGPIVRHYKHDAESFFWVVVYDTACNGSVNQWSLLPNSTLRAEKMGYLGLGTEVLPMREKHTSTVSWIEKVRKFLAREYYGGMAKQDFGIDELYNTLRELRDDQGETLAARIETRQAELRDYWRAAEGSEGSSKIESAYS